jgi:hypothetical protein
MVGRKRDHLAGALAALLALAAGCETYEPPSRPCAVTCAGDGRCPAEHTCGADGYCHLEGEPLCEAVRDGDGAADPGDRDAGAPDAEPVDAAPPDAVPCLEGNAQAVDEATGHCYMLFTSGAAWTSAGPACAALTPPAHLATIASASENEVVFSIVASRRTWMGASDAASEGTWVWSTGEPWGAYVKWRSGEPGNGGGGDPGEDCLEMASAGAGEWNDNECYVSAAYVCEREP